MQQPSFRHGEEVECLGRFHTPPADPEPVYPNHYNLVQYGPTDKRVKVCNSEEESQLEVEQDVGPLVVKKLDLCVAENTVAHHTDEYEITECDRMTGETPQLLVRRGQPFQLRVNVNRPYEKGRDRIQVQLETGNGPKVSKGTDQRLPLRNKLELRKWSVSLASQEAEVLVLTVQASPRAIVGRWRLYIETSLRTCDDDYVKEAPTVRRYQHGEDVYILFNPWCREDQVFMPDDTWRDETVLNETGVIYTGNYHQVANRPWNYGQFEDSILECALSLLDEAQLLLHIRHDPTKVVRAIASAVTGCSPHHGVLLGDWSGGYKGGTPPVVWVGSVKILEEHARTGRPVKYGQCWVFTGVCTTLCRTLGIPARSVTNFSSAHDCDGTVTMDCHWRHDGTPMMEQNDDYIWSFHSWNEAWMARPDLPTGYGGWQAFDSTPHETYQGAQQAGPCSVAAIRDGYVGFSSDGATFFAEVNADKVHWVLKEDATWWMSTDKAKVGKRISTKQPRKKRPGRSFNRLPAEDLERLDITHQYKFKEGSEQERTAIYRANLVSTRTGILANPNDDVKFDFDMPGDVLVGNNFELRLKMQNQSRHWRGVAVSLYFTACHYTGIARKLVKKQTYDLDIGPVKTQDCVMRIGHEEYLAFCVDHLGFKVKAMATVLETGQIFTSEDDFRLRRPDLNVQAPTRAFHQEDVTVSVKLVNPLPMYLTGCSWRVEGAGVEKMKTIPHRDVEPYDITEAQLTLRPRRKGKRQIQVCFTSNKLSDVTGIANIEIEA